MRNGKMKLFRIKLTGMKYSSIGTLYGCPYVVAESAEQALAKVQKYVRDNDLGFTNDREMESIELLAEEGDYPGCRIQLFL